MPVRNCARPKLYTPEIIPVRIVPELCLPEIILAVLSGQSGHSAHFVSRQLEHFQLAGLSMGDVKAQQGAELMKSVIAGRTGCST